MTHQFHYGRKFYLVKSRGYWRSCNKPRVDAHIWVWEYHHGERPEGYHVHHVDGDKSNNDISNLALLEASEHTRLHMSTPERKKQSSEMANKFRHLTKAWHASKEGREWHRKNGILCWEERQSFKGTCQECATVFETKVYHQAFCSNRCKSQSRRQSGIDDIVIGCFYCGVEVKKNKYSRIRFCGRVCSAKFYWDKKHQAR